MLMYLDGIAIGCFILFILMLIGRAHHIRKTGKYGNAGKFTILISWLLIICFFVSISGIAYGAANPTGFSRLTNQVTNVVNQHHHQQATTTNHHSSTADHQSRTTTDPKEVSWTPENPRLKNSAVKVKFTVPKETTVTIKGHLHHQQYGKITADETAKHSTIKFTYAGQYDVIITSQNGHQETATLIVK